MKRSMSYLLFAVPALSFLFIFIAFPLFYSFYLSFVKFNYVYDSTPQFTIFENYIDLFVNDRRFLIALKNNLIFGVFYFSLVMIISFLIAVVVNEIGKGKTFFQLSSYLPIIVGTSFAAIIFAWILDPTFGIFNSLLKKIGLSGLTTNWLGNSRTSLYALVVIKSWKYMGFTVIIFMAGLHSIPKQLYDAAKVDGANFIQEALHVTIPNLRQYTLMASLYSIIQAMKVFQLPYVATQGGPGNSTLTLYLYTWKSAFRHYHMGKASAIAYVTAGLILLLTVLARWILERKS